MPMVLTAPDGAPVSNYTFDDEALHEPGPEENWQESVAMWWYDPRTECTGFMRIGHEPRLEGGNMTLWCFFRTPEMALQRSEVYPKAATDIREAAFSAGDMGHYSYDGKATHWHVKTADAELDLHLTPLYQPIGLWPEISPDYAKNIGGHHFEVADRMQGSVTIKGARIALSGYAYRDHSWGPRNWFNLKVHRWANGLFGEEFGFGFSNYLVHDAEINRRGFIREGSVVHYTREVEILPLMECDGATHRGGVVLARLQDGRSFRFDLTPTGKGSMMVKRNNTCHDTHCRVSFGALTGFGLLEISENARRGTETLSTLVNTYRGNGLFPAG